MTRVSRTDAMASLEDLIRNAIKEGRLGGLSLWPCSTGFQSNLKNKHGGWECHVNEDPIVALRAALGEAPPAAVFTFKGGVFD